MICSLNDRSNVKTIEETLTEDMKILYRGATYLVVECGKTWDQMRKHFDKVAIVALREKVIEL